MIVKETMGIWMLKVIIVNNSKEVGLIKKTVETKWNNYKEMTDICNQY